MVSKKLEYPAMVYKNERTNVFVANCIMKNLMGFGKSEKAALKNLMETFSDTEKENISLKPIHTFSMNAGGV